MRAHARVDTDPSASEEKEIDEFSAFLVRAKLTKHERWLRSAGFAEVHDLAVATEEDIIAAQREYQRKENSEEKQNIEGLLMKKPESRRLRRAITKEMARILNDSSSESSRNSFASTKEILSNLMRKLLKFQLSFQHFANVHYFVTIVFLA